MQAHAEAREGVHTALFPVDDTDGRAAFQTSLPYGPDGIGRDAPPEVTTSSTSTTRSPGSNAPSSRFAVPYAFASPRTIRNGSREASEAAAASATAPSSGPAIRTASGSTSAIRSGEPRAERLEQLGHGLEPVLVQVVPRPPPRAQDEVALEVRVLAQRGEQSARRPRYVGARCRACRRASGSTVAPRASRRTARSSSRPRSRRRRGRGCAARRRKSTVPASEPATSSEPGEHPTPRHRSPPLRRPLARSRLRLRLLLGGDAAQACSSGRRRRARRWAPGPWQRRSSARRPGRRTRCPSRSRPRAAPARSSPSPAARRTAASSSVTVRANRSAAAPSSVDAIVEPSASRTTAASIWDETSVRSDRACAASIGGTR